MVKSDKLHELIRAMTPSEKRSFKIYASRHVIGGENNYVHLFDAIDRMKEYDEVVLRKAMKGQRTIRYLSAEKYYLYSLVLNSLDAFHAGSSVGDDLARQLHRIELLFEKGLYDQVSKLLARAKRLAALHDRFEDMLRVLQREREMAYRHTPVEGLASYLDSHYRQVEGVLAKLKNRYDYHALSDKMFALHKTKGIARSADDLAPYRACNRHPLMRSPKTALSFDALRFYYGAKMYYYHATGDLKRSHEYRRKTVGLMEKNRERLAVHPKAYVFALNNLLVTCILLDNEIEFYDTLNKLKSLPETLASSAVTRDLRARIFESHSIHETDYCIKKARFEEGIALAEHIGAELVNYAGGMDKAFEVTLYNNMTCLYFGAGDFRKALHWLNRILNENGPELREDILCYARIINLIIHFELGNMLTLPYLLRSTYRFLSGRRHLHQFETIILHALRQILRTRNERELPGLFSKLREDLRPLLDDPYEKVLFDDIDIISWLESRITKRSYAEIVGEKVV